MDNSDSASKESKKTQDGNGSKELSGLENEPGEGSCEDENEDDETGVNPLLKSVRYLEKHRVIRLFQNLAAEVVYKRPDNPLEFIAKKLEATIEAERNQGEDKNSDSLEDLLS